MAGYTRQSSGLIVTSATILASHSENEFAALGTAFGASGHDHSGSGGNGAQLTATGLAADSVTTVKILNGNVTYAKIQNVSATDKILGRVSSGAGVVEEITFTDAAQQLADDTTHAAMLVTLGLTATAAELNTLSGITSSVAELNILDGVTATASEINTLAGITSSTAELNILDGVTATAAELNIMDGVTATAVELNILDGATLTVTELNYVDGVTSAIQTQLDGKEAADADILKADTTDTLTVGYNVTDYSVGTKSTGTYTPDPALGNQQYAVNGGAHTLAPPASSCTMVIQYTNNGSAGTITTSGFTKVDGAFTTTNGHDFMCFITRVNGFSYLSIVELQ